MSLNEKTPQLLLAWRFFRSRLAAPIVSGILMTVVGAGITSGQTPATNRNGLFGTQLSADEQMRFEVASVRMSQPGTPLRTNFGLDSFEDTGRLNGLFSANIYLKGYIVFAYHLPSFEEQEVLLEDGLRRWEGAGTPIAIEARAEGHPTKSQVRVMVRNLLEKRLHLKMRSEIRQLPVNALVFAEAGKFGPGLRPHVAADGCEERTTPNLDNTPKERPAHRFCGDANWQEGNLLHVEMVGTTLSHLAEFLTELAPFQGGSRQLIVDGTGDAERFDMSLVFRRYEKEENNTAPNATGQSAIESVKKQLGLKLVKETRPVSLLAIEHIEKPSEN